MNGSNGIQPTVELATTNGNGFYPYPVMTGGNGGFGGFGNDGALWLIVLLALIWGGNGNNGFGGFGGNSFDNGYAWLSNGQKDIMSQTSDGFNSLHLSNQVEGIRSDVNDIQNAICSSTASINSNISNGFYNSEIAAANRQMADMNQNYANQISTLQSFNGLERQLCECCADNRLATCQTQNIVQNEGNATRFADANNTRDIITNATANTQSILDKLCQLELDGFKRENDQLRSQLQFANMQASQVQQTADLRANNATVANQLVTELRACPIPSQPVYGNQPIFSCQPSYGCGCGNWNTTSQFI